MRAAVLTSFDKSLALQEVADPDPDDSQVVLRVRATGICGSDVKISRGLIPGLRTPLILGHEVAGEVVKAGDDTLLGQRVAAYIFQPCRSCEWCKRELPNLCPTAPRLGFERDGGLAEFVVMDPRNLIPLPDPVSFEAAAVSMDAVLTPWRALKVHARVEAGQTVLIAGAGGLGQHAVQIAKAAGARVAVIDSQAGQLLRAEDLGADIAVLPVDMDKLVRWAPVGFDVGLEASGSPEAFNGLAGLIKPGGILVCCGYKPGAPFAVDSTKLALGELHIVGSRGGTIQDAQDAMAAVGRGEISPAIAAVGTLEDAPEFLNRLASGRASGRLVVKP